MNSIAPSALEKHKQTKVPKWERIDSYIQEYLAPSAASSPSSVHYLASQPRSLGEQRRVPRKLKLLLARISGGKPLRVSELHTCGRASMQTSS